jgi:hypothetical protein
MSITLSELLQTVMAEMGLLQVSLATGGSDTTIVDDDQKLVHGMPDAWKNGTVFIVRDAGGNGASPEGRFATVTAYDDSTGTFTFASITDSVAAGDQYGFVSSEYPLQQLIVLANRGLRENVPKLPFYDRTTIETANDQREYSAAAVWQHPRPVSVEIETITNDSDRKGWQPIHNYLYEPASSAGGQGKIIFLDDWPSGRDIRVGYYDYQPSLYAYDDYVDSRIARNVAKWAVALTAWRWKRNQGGSVGYEDEINVAKAELKEALKQDPIPRINAPAGHIVTYTRS